MKRLIKKLEDIFAAVSFAEAGEADFAREILRESGVKPSTEKQGGSTTITFVHKENAGQA